MTMDADLRDRLEAAHTTLADLVARLEAHGSLTESLTNANGLLGQAAQDTSELVKSAQFIQGALSQTLENIQGVIDVLSRLDPAPVLLSIEAVQASANENSALTEEQLKILRESLSASSQMAQRHLESITSLVQEQSGSLRETFSAASDATQQQFESVTTLIQEQSGGLRETLTATSRATQQQLASQITSLSAQQKRDARSSRILGAITLLAATAATAAAVISFIALNSP